MFARMYQELRMIDANVQAAVQQNDGAIAKAVGQTGSCSSPTPSGCGALFRWLVPALPEVAEHVVVPHELDRLNVSHRR
jgi:hypothetical protein